MELVDLQLNERAMEVANELIEQADDVNIVVHNVGESVVLDCGVETPGSLRSGSYMASACLADMGGVDIRADRLAGRPCPRVEVEIDAPVAACLLSQYAGWKVAHKKFFAMTSGPIRALVAEEPLFEQLDYREESEVAVAVMETRKLPSKAVIDLLVKASKVEADQLVVLAAPTASLAGGVQVVARSVETCLHKLFELGFDVTKIRSATGAAYLPPVPKDDLVAIGRTNDSILYGAEVCLWVECEDAEITDVGARLPAAASSDYGRPFSEVFQKAGGDFYKIDPMLFSPALVFINNLTTGNTFLFGKTDYDLLSRSFYGDSQV
jgi:methenyltetrahydromethanopterin cyclohydrolase